MNIRRLQPADAAAYRALRLRALREHPEAFTSSFEEEAEKPLEASQARLASGVKMWGAFGNGQELCGMVGLDREPRAKNRHKATVVAMYVAPERAGRGAGRALLAALLDDARATAGLQSLVLTVTAGNARAARLYETAGFRSFGNEPNAVQIDGRPYAKTHMHLQLPLQPTPP